MPDSDMPTRCGKKQKNTFEPVLALSSCVLLQARISSSLSTCNYCVKTLQKKKKKTTLRALVFTHEFEESETMSRPRRAKDTKAADMNNKY